MNRNQLAIFHMVAQTGSISRAAGFLHVTQPAVSKQIADLEARLGHRLFDRMPAKGTRLTEAGTMLADFARRIAALEDQAENALRCLRDLGAGNLAVGASSTIGTYLLPPVLAIFRERYPGIAVRLEIGNSDRIKALMREGTIDLGFTEGPHADEDLVAETFLRDELVIIARVGHPLLAEREIDAACLCRQSFVVRESGSGTRAVFERAIAARGLALRPAMTLGNNEAIKQAVAASDSLAPISRLAIELELQAGRLAVVHVATFHLPRDLELLQLRGKHRTRAAVAFIAAIREILPRAMIAA